MPKVDFASPAWLLLALAVPPLVAWWLKRRRTALRYPGADLLAGLPRGRARAARIGGALFRGVALLGVVLALAGPRTPDLRTRIDTEGVAIFIAVDVSGSMAGVFHRARSFLRRRCARHVQSAPTLSDAAGVSAIKHALLRRY